MYSYHAPKSELTQARLREIATRFEHIETPSDLAVLLKKEEPALLKLAAAPKYQEFFIPKPGGEKRFIQHPDTTLKSVQQELNRYLQAVYYFIKPACAHGFIVVPTDEAQPRNIYSNASAHTRSHWFINVDLKDFFHTVTDKHVYALFRYTLGYEELLARLLTRLCCFKGRLPMGAPTSPVISNMVLYFTDYRFMAFAAAEGGIYTRYADDLTFSFVRPPSDSFLDQVRHELLKSGFIVNEKKVRLQGRLDQPEITGLVIGKGNQPVLSRSWLKTLKKEIATYRWLVSETVMKRGMYHAWLFDPFRKSIEGQLEFAGFVLGKTDRTYLKMKTKLKMPVDFG